MFDKKKDTAKHGRHAANGKHTKDREELDSAPSSADADETQAIRTDKETAKAESSSTQSQQDTPSDEEETAPVSDATVAMPTVPASANTAVQPPVYPAAGQSFAAAGVAGAASAFDMGQAAEATKNPRKKRVLKILGIVFGVLLGLLLIAYVGVAIYFTERFMPRSTIGNLDVSMMTAQDAQSVLTDEVDDYTLYLSGQGIYLKLSSEDAGLSIDAQSVIATMLDDMNPWLWPLELTREHDETARLVASYNETGLDEAIRNTVDTFNESAIPPTDATISYDEDKDTFVIAPEAVGTALDVDEVIKAADTALVELDPQVKISSEQLLQPKVFRDDPKLATAVQSANTMIKVDLTLNMAGAPAAQVNADLVSQWVRLDEEVKAAVDEGALTAWVDQFVADCNTVGTQRTYTRPDGKVITVAGGPYGWAVDRDALLGIVRDAVTAGSTSTADVPCSSTGTAYNGPGQQDWGARYCDIDLAEQYVRFYDEAGALIWESPCISGKPDGQHDTSVGVFWLNQKASPSKLIGYENGVKIYESTVQYWMPFDGNAIGLHDADWQPAFGGTLYAQGYGSHGCVNLPPARAAELYGIIQSGDVVVSHW